ncbi:MAG: 50S ribosomal protein L28 [Candidatus Margulisbacteria bacterium]|jgi:large subunit ribosomal protein L28|nr:50S ribosomal protein L28 [Candidatus Margulisiibacteriota bacterium]
MSYKCAVCGKQVVTGNKVSHSKRHTRTKWLPNLQNIKIILHGRTRKAKVCTSCIRSGKITKPAPRILPQKATA